MTAPTPSVRLWLFLGLAGGVLAALIFPLRTKPLPASSSPPVLKFVSTAPLSVRPEELAATDPLRALEIAAAEPDPARSSSLFRFIFTRWARRNPEAALAAALTLSNECDRTLVSLVFSVWHDGLLATVADPDGDTAVAINALRARWAALDAPGMAEHALNVSDPDQRRELLSRALGAWARVDAVAAAAWTDRFDAAPEFDAGAAAIARHAISQNRNADTALSWVESISDPELRASTLIDTVRQWATFAPDQMRRYVASSPALADEDRHNLLAQLPKTATPN